MSWKKILALVTIVLALVLLSVVWWFSRYDVNQFKPLIAKQVRAATARDITLEGDLRLRIGLAPTLITGPVKLRNADWGSQPDMLTVEELELQVGLRDLLSKRIVLKRMLLIKPMALLEEKPGGNISNWEFDQAPAGPPPSPPDDSGAYEIQLEEVAIQDGQLILRNNANGEVKVLQVERLDLQRQGGDLPLKVDLKAVYAQNPFSVAGAIGNLNDLIGTRQDWPFDLAASAAQSDLAIAGRLQRSSGPAPLRLDAKITGSRLDLRPWLGDPAGGATTAKAAHRVFPDTPLPFDLLRDIDLKVDMDIRELLLPHNALQDFVSTLHIEDGRLALGPARAKAGGGDYRAQMQIDGRATPPAVKASLQIDQMNAGLMLKQLGLGDVMEGVLDAQADMEGQGHSVAQLMAGLNGHAMLVSGEGRLGKLFFGLFDEGVADQLVTLLNPLKKRSATTPIECLVIRFDSQDGMAELSQMVWVTPDSIVVGGGRIDLKTEKIDIGIQPTPKQGKISLGALTKPFRLGGTLGSPALRIDTTATAITAGRIAGGLLFGPVGIAVAFSSIVGTEAGNPCVAAVEAAEKGVATDEKGFLESVGDKLRFWKKD